MEIVFLGTAGGLPNPRRNFPSIAIVNDNQIALLDCGEGSSRQFLKAKMNFACVEAILMTHIHFDHILGLPSFLLKTWLESERTPEIFIPRNSKAILDCLVKTMPVIPKVRVKEVVCSEDINVCGFKTSSAEADHTELAIAYALTNGTKKVVYSGDTQPCPSVKKLANKADILIHDATFADGEYELARRTGHSTSSQAGKVAADAEVGMLVLTHIDPRYDGKEEILVKQARKIYKGKILVAEDLLRIQL